MAKVKNQIYDGSEETYTDASGVIHFFGESFRHIMPNAYPLPSLNSTGVTRKSPRGYKPSQQGHGSAAQRPWRDCFALCAERWDSLPDECEAIPTCPAHSSKNSVWDAKQAQGVMCSYFDLYMDCCLSSCTEISIIGPDGISVTGGAISDDDNCWPCVPPCMASELSIAYASQQMVTGEIQLLMAHDSAFGDSIPCCHPEELSWELVSGGGSLSSFNGPSTLYTASDNNIDCANNPTIKLTDCCGRSASLQLAVSATGYDPSQNAVYTYTDKEENCFPDANCPGSGCVCPPPVFAICNCSIVEWIYNCAGELIHGPDMCETQVSFCAVEGKCLDTDLNRCAVPGCPYSANELESWSPIDGRSAEQITAGCCPALLL